MPAFYPENDTSLVSDNEMRSLHKLVNVLAGAPGGGGGMVHSTVGSGSPEGVVVGSPGDKYLDGDIDAIWTKKTGAGTTCRNYTGSGCHEQIEDRNFVSGHAGKRR